MIERSLNIQIVILSTFDVHEIVNVLNFTNIVQPI